MDDWVNYVPRVENGKTTFSADDMNEIIDSLVNRTNYLYEALVNLSGNQGYIMTDSGFTASCKKGTIVTRNADGLYEPAEAKWSDKVRADGSWIQDSKANVVGVLLSDPDNEGNGVIMSAGWSADPELIDILAPDKKVGDYYLTTNGKATCNSDQSRDIRVYCYSYLGTGKITINPHRAEYAGHSHNSIKIETPWVNIINSATAPSILPGDAKAYITVKEQTNAQLYSILKSNPQYPCLVKNGVEVDNEDWGIEQSTDEIFIYLYFVPVDTDIFHLHAITPLLSDEPLVRTIKTTRDNKLLTVHSVGGKVWLGMNLEPAKTNEFTGFGVTEITADGIKTGPIIQGVKAGPGVSVTTYRDKGSDVNGVVEIAASQYKNTLLDMSVCNLNQVIIGTSFNGVSYIFPADSAASLIGTMRIPHFTENNAQKGELVFVFQGNGADINGLSAQVMIQPTPPPSKDGEVYEVGIPSSVTHSVPPIQTTDTNNCYCVTVALGGDEGQCLHSDGLIICKLMAASTAPEITLVSMSFRLV